MSLSWKDTVATVSFVIVMSFSIALLLGAYDGIEGRWALATFGLFLMAGLTGLITGTVRMLQRTWSSIGLYALSISAIIIALVNAILNSQLWFIAMVATFTLLWLEYVGIDLFSRSDRHKHIHRRGV
jgi:hypothetical protein